MGLAVVVTAVVGFEPVAQAVPEQAEDEAALPEPEPVDVDPQQEAMEEAVDQAEAVAEAEEETTSVDLPPGALDGTAGPDLLGGNDPTTLRPNGDEGAVYPGLADPGSSDPTVVDDGVEPVSEPLEPDALLEELQETSDSLSEEGVTGEMVAAAQSLDLDELEPGDEVTELRTVDSRTILEEDGSLRTEVGSEPMFAEIADGDFVEPNLTPRPGNDDRWRSHAGRPGTSFGETAGDERLGSVSFGEGRRVSWGLEDAEDVVAERHGERVVYDDVMAGVDVEMEASLTGVKETIVISDPDAPRVYEFPLNLEGLEAELEDPYGSVVLTDAETGEPVGVIPSAWVMDSAPGPDGMTPDPGPVTYELVGEGADAVLRVEVDEEWFTDPARVFPVVVDPTVGDFRAAGDTWVHNQYPTTNRSTDGFLKTGGGGGNRRTYFARWDVGWLASATILDASYSTFNSYSYSCTPSWFGVYRVTSNWNPATVTWGTQPSRGELLGAGNFAHGWPRENPSCARDWIAFRNNPNVTRMVQRWVDGVWPAYGVTGRAGANDSYNIDNSYKEFLSSEAGDNGGQILTVTWSPWRVDYALAPGYVEPTATTPGSINIRVRNLAPTTWRATGSNRYRLGYHVYRADGSTLITYGAAQVDLPQDVSWRESVVVTVPLAPRAVGEYQYKFDMLQLGVGWFSKEAIHADLMPLATRISVGNTPPGISYAVPAGQVETRTPSLQVTGANPDNYPSGGLQYLFNICENEDMWTGCTNSGWQSSNRWPPANLVWGKTYYWNAAVRETGTGAMTTYPGWKAPVVPTLVQPTLERHFGQDAHAPGHLGVNPSIGNYVTSATDIQVASAGLPVELTRTYNSMDERTGAFGIGWSTFLDLSATTETGGRLLVSFPDGHQERYGQNPDGTWASPAGNASVLRSVTGGGWELQHPDRTTYVFNGSGQPTAIRDGWGHELTLRRDTAGRVDRVTNAPSGRYMDLTWAAQGPNGAYVITQATTNPAATGEAAPTWGYTYSTGGRLKTVCAPGEPEPNKACTTYNYYGSGTGAVGKLHQVVRQEGNDAIELGYQPDGTVAWVENGTDDRWTFSDDDASAEGTYHPVAGWRAANAVTVNGGATTTVDVTGSGGVPDTGVQAVVVDIESASLSSGWFGVYPSATPEPAGVSTMDYAPGYRSTLHTVAVGSDGKIALTNHGSGASTVTFDVVGWYALAGVEGGSVFVPTPTTRILDTRTTGGALTPGAVRSVPITGQGDIPTDGVTGVVYDLEMVGASALTNLTAYASGVTRPSSITTAVTGGGNVDNLHVTAVGSDGKIAIHNSAGSVHVLVDVVGYFADPNVHPGNVYRPVTNQRLMDTRGTDGQWTTPWPANTTRAVTVAGEGTLPARGVTGVVGDVQSIAPASTHYMRSGPSGAANSGATYFAQAGQGVGNHLYSGVAGNGAFDLYSQNATGVVVDVVGYFTPVPRSVHVEDPRGNSVEYRYDNLGRLVGRIDQAGYQTAWAYDDDGFLSSVRNEAGEGNRYRYDEDGHVVSDTRIRLHGDPFQSDVIDLESTTYYGYIEDPADPAVDGKVSWVADGRSADADDTSYRTTYTYDPHGQPLTVRGPATSEAEGGFGTTNTYTAGGAQPAPCPTALGNAPAGLIQTETDAAGLITRYCYDNKGDLREVHRPSGMVQQYSYDGLGRVTTRTEVSDAHPAGVTTTRAYDAKGRVIRRTGPRVTSSVPNAPDGQYHRTETTVTYTPNGNTDRVTVTDTENGEARWLDYGYDSADRVTDTLDNADRTTARTYDSNGNINSETDVDGLTTTYAYNSRDLVQTVTAQDVVDNPIDAPSVTRDVLLAQYYYYFDGRLDLSVDATGLTTHYHWQPNGQLAHATHRNARDTNAETGLSEGPQRTALAAATQVDRAGNPIASFAPSDVSYLDGFTGTQLASGWQTTGTWTVANDTLTSGSAGAMSWRPGTRDGQVGVTVDDSATLSVLFRVQDAQNYFKLEWTGTQLELIQVTNGVEDVLQGNTATAPVKGTRIEVNFTADRLWVLRSGVRVMDTGIPDDIPGTGVGLVATAAGQEADRFRFDAYQRTENTFDAYGRQIGSTVDPGGANLRTEVALRPDGQPTAVYRSTGADATAVAQTSYGYDSAGFLDWSEDLVADPDPNPDETDPDVETYARTDYTYDDRGLSTHMVSPEGAVVDLAYDEVGQLVTATGPARDVEGYGQATQPDVRSTERYAYTGFGELSAVQDSAGRLTSFDIDDRGFPVEATLPSYTAPGTTTPVERTVTATYDDAGRVLTETDPLGATTQYTYNTLGLLDGLTEPAAGGDPAGVWELDYDNMGRPVSMTDPTGAQTVQRRDSRGRVTAIAQSVRQPALATYVSASTLGDAGGAVRSRSPEGVVSTAAYDLAGRPVTTADADGNTTSYGYDDLGRPAEVTTPDGRQLRTAYDLVGNTTAEQLYAANGALVGEAQYDYDLDNRLVATHSPRGVTEGFSTGYVYDDAGQLTQRTTPVQANQTITESWGYDALGQTVRYTDGRLNTTWQTYNTMGLPEDAIEPAAGSHTAVADRRWRTVYDAAGQPVTQQAPGGVTVTSEYDNLGRLIHQSGSGAQAQTATRNFDYDQVGQLVSASTTAGTQTFSYDDRGLLLSSSGVAGDSSFTYDGDGRLSQRTDSSGTTGFTYDNRGLPDTMDSGLSGTVSYDFDESGRPTTVDYGDGTTRAYGYDDWGRVDTDALATGATTLYGVDYGYDADGNITSKNVTGTDVPAAGLNQYSYDQASRITGWTNPAGTTEPYAWDAAGNRTQAGTNTATFDQQNRLTRTEGADGLVSNTWLANGTLDQTTTQRRVSLVVANPASLTQAENVLLFGLTTGGGQVTLVDDVAAAPAAGGVDVLVISPNVDTASIAATYKDIAVPVVNYASGTWQANGLTNTAATTGTAASATVATEGHQIAAGKTGTVSLLNSSDTIAAAPATSLGTGATTVWKRSTSSTDAVVATYGTGSATPTGQAPARRVLVGLSATALTKLNADGAAVIQAAVAWADDNDATFGTTNFDFDAFEQLSRITPPGGAAQTHTYDPLGRRLTSPTGALTYSGGSIRPSADGAHRYQPGPVGTIATDDMSNGDGQWAHADQHTDVVAAFTPGATTLAGAQTFTPWGQPQGATGDSLALGYQSERQDLPGGLVGMGAREYNPDTATFITHDPVTDPTVPNGYSYTPSNPLTNTDPTGLSNEIGAGSGGPCPDRRFTGGCGNGGGGGGGGLGRKNKYPQGGSTTKNQKNASGQSSSSSQNYPLSPSGGGGGSSGGGGGGGGSGGSGGSSYTPPPPYMTPDSVIRNGPSTPPPRSETATRVEETGSAVPNYPGRYQTDSSGRRVDTGNASIPTTPVVPTPTNAPPDPVSPEINPTTLPQDSPIQFNNAITDGGWGEPHVPPSETGDPTIDGLSDDEYTNLVACQGAMGDECAAIGHREEAYCEMVGEGACTTLGLDEMAEDFEESVIGQASGFYVDDWIECANEAMDGGISGSCAWVTVDIVATGVGGMGDDAIRLGDEIAAAGQVADEVARGGLSRAAEYGIKPYTALRSSLSGTGLQAHHLIERRFAALLGVSSNEMLSVAVTVAEHRAFTNAWRRAIPYGSGTANATREQVLNVARQIYANHPEILRALGLS